MADVTLKRHDTFPAIKATLEEAGKVPINLTGALKVTLLMKSGATLIEGACTIVSATKGEVSYTFVAKDTETAGTFQLEFEIEWSAGKYQTVPNAGYKEVLIEADLGTA